MKCRNCDGKGTVGDGLIFEPDQCVICGGSGEEPDATERPEGYYHQSLEPVEEKPHLEWFEDEDEQQYEEDGQPDEAQEWKDFDPDA